MHCRGSHRALASLSDLHRSQSSALENKHQRSHPKAWLTSLPAVGQLSPRHGGRKERDRTPELSTADQRVFHCISSVFEPNQGCHPLTLGATICSLSAPSTPFSYQETRKATMQEQGSLSYCPLNNSTTSRGDFLEETRASLCNTPSLAHLEQLYIPSTSRELPQHFQWPSFYFCMQGSWPGPWEQGTAPVQQLRRDAVCGKDQGNSNSGSWSLRETKETQTQVPAHPEDPSGTNDPKAKSRSK